MRTIRASEVGTFVYCQRAWWYSRHGEPSENLGELAAGTELHYQHGRAMMRVGCARYLAYGLILLAIVLVTVEAMSRLF